MNKQASDDEDNEIEIVEPKTDTITIDSDNEDDGCSDSNSKKIIKITSVASQAPKTEALKNQVAELPPSEADMAAFSSTILASLLEVDITEGTAEPKSVSPGHKKQPRKKTTNKPNPALLQLERQRMEEIKHTDAKLKMKVRVVLRRAEEEFEVARKWAKNRDKQNKIWSKAHQTKTDAQKTPADGPNEIPIQEEKEPQLCSTGQSSPNKQEADKETEKAENDKSEVPREKIADDDHQKLGVAGDKQQKEAQTEPETEAQTEPETEAQTEPETEAQTEPEAGAAAVDQVDEKEFLSINPVVREDLEIIEPEAEVLKEKCSDKEKSKFNEAMDTSTESFAAKPLERMDIDIPSEKTDAVDEAKDVDGMGLKDLCNPSPIVSTAEADSNLEIVAPETDTETSVMPPREPIPKENQIGEVCNSPRESEPLTENGTTPSKSTVTLTVDNAEAYLAGLHENVDSKVTTSEESTSNATTTRQLLG
ncbi:GL20097 [Drosophila persimilis]|uniref:GL20097 n=1 Tax=Drosophila persimilis TaxID=7234 RepID=B4H8H8_DROPE|nr:GL20097 [Drosophila persimilis]